VRCDLGPIAAQMRPRKRQKHERGQQPSQRRQAERRHMPRDRAAEHMIP
jgi:hypothetical protein